MEDWKIKLFRINPSPDYELIKLIEEIHVEVYNRALTDCMSVILPQAGLDISQIVHQINKLKKNDTT